MTWHDVDKELVKKMWKTGEYSASDIALILRGKSRNAVIGLCDRNKWEKGTSVKPRRKPRPQRDHVTLPNKRGGRPHETKITLSNKLSNKPNFKLKPGLRVTCDKQGKGVSLMDAKGCKYPNVNNTAVCNVPRSNTRVMGSKGHKRSSVYCDKHHEICYVVYDGRKY